MSIIGAKLDHRKIMKIFTDWDDLRLFQALANAATVRAAAAGLGISHSTLSRRLDTLEGRLGVTLFDRGPRGFKLTEAGAILLESVDDVSTSIDRGLLQVAGIDKRMEGLIRITLPDFLAFYCLLQSLESFRATHPKIELEVDISYASFDLDRREADVAIRMIALDQSPPPSLVGRKVGISAATGFATDAYLKGKDLTDPRCGAVWLGWAPDDSIDWVTDTPFPHLPIYGVFNHAELQHHAAIAGMGIAYLPLIIGDNDPRLHRVPGMTPKPSHDIWVLSHADLRETVRMKTLRDWVSQTLVSARGNLSE